MTKGKKERKNGNKSEKEKQRWLICLFACLFVYLNIRKQRIRTCHGESNKSHILFFLKSLLSFISFKKLFKSIRIIHLYFFLPPMLNKYKILSERSSLTRANSMIIDHNELWSDVYSSQCQEELQWKIQLYKGEK